MVLKRYLCVLLGFVLLSAVSSCAKKPEEEVIDAIDEANYLLSQSTPECQKAITLLEKLGRQNSNPLYLSTLASAYACRGGFSELTLFDEVDTISSTFDEFLGSLTEITISDETSAESSRFNDLQTAIDLILFAGGKTVPSAVQQKTIFGNRHGNNMNLQAMYMILIQLGRYSQWYGNTDAAGNKGGGPSGSTCFMDYTNGGAATIANTHGGGNVCVTANAGHPDLDYTGVTTAVAQKRLCQGVMLLNNMLDILENTTLSSNSSLGSISTIYADIEPYINTASALDPDMPAFIDNLLQSQCETVSALDDRLLQLYFAALFEYALP